MSFPQSITVIRHGEKPTTQNHDLGIDEYGKEHPDSLSPRGWQRAGALAALLGSKALYAPFVRPDVLYSCGYQDNPDGSRHRPYETLLPLSRRLGLDIRVPVLQTEGPALVSEHLMKVGRADVLVCWEHKNIPPIAAALAQELGITTLPAVAQLWPEHDFHSALIFTCAGESWQVTQVSEDVLGGDA